MRQNWLTRVCIASGYKKKYSHTVSPSSASLTLFRCTEAAQHPLWLNYRVLIQTAVKMNRLSSSAGSSLCLVTSLTVIKSNTLASFSLPQSCLADCLILYFFTPLMVTSHAIYNKHMKRLLSFLHSGFASVVK